MTGESKMELRGHEHVVEVITWAPVAAYAAIRELGGLPVGSLMWHVRQSNFPPRTLIAQSGLDYFLQVADEIGQLSSGMDKVVK
jgi:hypothetical protein